MRLGAIAITFSLLTGCGVLRQHTDDQSSLIALGAHSAVTPVTQDREPRSYDWLTRHKSTRAYVVGHNPELVFLGDSIFHNLGGPIIEATRPPTGQAVWERYYADRNAMNLGFGWDRTENVIYRLEDGVLDGASPRLAVVMIGTNNLSLNSADEIAQGITAICELLHERCPTTPILLLAIFPRNDASGLRFESVRERVNQIISQLNRRPYITFLDIAENFYDDQGRVPRSLMSDGLHPTLEGYRLMAQAIEPHIERVLDDANGE